MNKRYYIVAEHLFCVEADEKIIKLLTNYAPFITEATQNALFSLTVTDGGPIQYVEELSQDEEGQDIVCGHTEQGDALFEFRFEGRTAGWLVCSAGYRESTLYLSGFQILWSLHSMQFEAVIRSPPISTKLSVCSSPKLLP